MKTTLTPFTMSELATPSGNKVPVRGKTIDITRFDVEIFEEGKVARLIFWLEDGSSTVLIIKTPIMRGTAPPDATER